MSEQNKEITYRILVIDDNEAIHNDFRKIFSQKEIDIDDEKMDSILLDTPSKTDHAHFQLEYVFSGDAGITLIEKSIEEKKPYAIVISDVRMPYGMDGVETVTRIFEIEDNVQVVLCSAYSDYEWQEMLTKIKNSDRWLILKKPFDITEVRQIILSLCKKWLLQLDMKGEIEKQTKEIKRLAYYDQTTELPNRRFFKELLKQSIDDADRADTLLALFFIDVDDFKKINDTYGHEVGDRFLKKMSERLSKILRKSDFLGRVSEGMKKPLTTTSRLGGDEFTILFRNFTNVEDLRMIAKRILERCSDEVYKIKGNSIKASVSIGISLYPRDGKTPEILLKNADIAMYQAKKNGKNQFIIHNKELNKKIVERHLLEQELYTAIKEDQLFMLYQPKISFKTRKVIGCEALLRWHHPTKGLLVADDFIPIAEESSLILQIDKLVLLKVCEQIHHWNSDNLIKDIIVSMNISARFFNDNKIIKVIKDTLLKYKIPPEILEIEITESYLMRSRKFIIERLKELRSLLNSGIKISIDDFGTGYSSFSYLNEFPLDTLKIDRSFIEKLNDNKNGKAIVRAMIDLSHHLNLNVVAEGIEQKEQYQFLKENLCDEAQGYLLAKPLAPEQFIEFLRTHKEKG